MSNYFYIQTQQGDIYELSVVSEIKISNPTSSTDFPIESGYNISDNVVNGNTRISYQGILTNIVNVSLLHDKGFRSIQENITALLDLRNSREYFSVNYDNRDTKDNILPALDYCVFNNLTFSRSSGDSDSYKVSIDVKQLILSSKAKETFVTQSEEVEKQSSGISDNSSNSTNAVDQDTRDLSLKIFDGTVDFVYGKETTP